VGGILADGSSLWEQLQPIAQLLKEFQNDCAAGQPQIFYSEVLNDETASVNTAFDITAIPAYPYDETELSAGAYVIIDPATDKANADHVAIVGFIIIDVAAKLSPGDTIREALRMCISLGASLIAIESQAYQYSLLYWTTVVFDQLGIQGISVVDIYTGQRSKNTRILEMFKQLVPPKTGGNVPDILLHPDIKASVTSEILGFNPLKTNNTDNILDCLTYAPRVMEQFSHLIAINLVEASDIPELPYEEYNSPI
jgi:hypothetical protein